MLETWKRRLQARRSQQPAASNFGRRDEIKRENASNKKIVRPSRRGRELKARPTHTHLEVHLPDGGGREVPSPIHE